MDKKIDTFQKVMLNAYHKWGDNEWTVDEFFDHLTFQERIAVALGNLNYQVQNGGFEQWITNGYAIVHLNFLLNLLKKKTTNLKKVYDILIKVNSEVKDKDLFEYEGEETEEKWENLDMLDTKYYKINNEKLLYEMNELIKSSK